MLERRADWPRIREQARRFVETERTWARSVAGYAEPYEALRLARIRPRSASQAARVVSDVRHFPRHPATGRLARTPPTRFGRWASSRSTAVPTTKARTSTGHCAFGIRRLSIIDVDGGHQPLTNEDRTLWLIANGEIYNYRELRDDLVARGHRFKTHSDCETILHLYQADGDAFVERLNGMYAFALWDSRRKRLLIGRDRLGVKPLYLWQDGRRLIFASEAKAILAVSGVARELDPAALQSYLALGYVPAPQSIFRGIRKLPPATLLAAGDGRLEERRYWRVPPAIDRLATESEWIARIRARLEESVRMQMVSDVPIGAFLSGGIDSSAVVAFMSAHSDGPVKTYSIGFGGGEAEAFYNELPYARQVAQQFHTDHHEIIVKPDVVSLLPRLLWHMDEPIADTAFITTYLVSEFARRDVTVILSGVGGDELFGGYRRYLGSRYQGYFDRLPSGLQRAAFALGEKLPSDRHSPLLNAMRLAKGFLVSAGLPFEERYRSYIQVFSDEMSAALLQRAPLAPTGIRSRRHSPMRQATTSSTGCFASTRKRSCPDDLLLLTDKMSMAVSLECRVPLLDHELTELAARDAGSRQDSRRPAEARDEGGAQERASARHPRTKEARLRHADGRMAQGRSGTARARSAVRGIDRGARAVSTHRSCRVSLPTTRRTVRMAPTACFRSSTSKSGRASTSTAGNPRTSPTSSGP